MADNCVKIKGTSTTAGSTITASNFNRAHFVRIQSEAADNVITLKNSSGSTLGTLVLRADGDCVIIEKEETDTLQTSGNATGVAVSSPR